MRARRPGRSARRAEPAWTDDPSGSPPSGTRDPSWTIKHDRPRARKRPAGSRPNAAGRKGEEPLGNALTASTCARPRTTLAVGESPPHAEGSEGSFDAVRHGREAPPTARPGSRQSLLTCL